MANSSTKSNQNGSKNQTPTPPFFPPNYNPASFLKGEKSERFWFATAMIPLRLFLGISFIAAGLDKLTDPQFFNSSAPGYIGQQLTGFAQSSPIGSFLTNVAVPNATLFGWMVLLGELAIGLGTIVGLFSRTAAFFGAVLSLTLWVSSSFNVVPFFLGPDLPYAIGWITLMLAGPHPVWSLDSYIKAPAPTPVKPVPTPAKNGKQAQPVVVVAAATPDPVATAQMARRRFVLIAGATLVTGMATGVAWAKTWKEENTKATTFNNLQANAANSSSSDTSATTAAPAATTGSDQATSAAPAASGTSTTQAAQTAATSGGTTTQAAAPAVKGTKLVALASLPVGAGFKFTTPDTNRPAMVFHEQDGSVKAFSLICTHEGCEVEYYQQYKALACPCHGAVYDITNGQPTQGPARRPLTAYKVQVDGSGNVIYVQ